jgi:hypothetical protein
MKVEALINYSIATGALANCCGIVSPLGVAVILGDIEFTQSYNKKNLALL